MTDILFRVYGIKGQYKHERNYNQHASFLTVSVRKFIRKLRFPAILRKGISSYLICQKTNETYKVLGGQTARWRLETVEMELLRDTEWCNSLVKSKKLATINVETVTPEAYVSMRNMMKAFQTFHTLDILLDLDHLHQTARKSQVPQLRRGNGDNLGIKNHISSKKKKKTYSMTHH